MHLYFFELGMDSIGRGGREERRISECLVGCTFISWYRAHWVRRREEEWASV